MDAPCRHARQLRHPGTDVLPLTVIVLHRPCSSIDSGDGRGGQQGARRRLVQGARASRQGASACMGDEHDEQLAGTLLCLVMLNLLTRPPVSPAAATQLPQLLQPGRGGEVGRHQVRRPRRHADMLPPQHAERKRLLPSPPRCFRCLHIRPRPSLPRPSPTHPHTHTHVHMHTPPPPYPTCTRHNPAAGAQTSRRRAASPPPGPEPGRRPRSGGHDWT